MGIAAQDFPNRQVELVVPFAAGGSTDAMARIMAPKMSELLKAPVIIVNKPGAAGVIAMKYVLSANNAYRVGVAGGTNVGTVLAASKTPPYQLNDIAGIGRAVVNPLVIVAKSGRFSNFAALLKEGKDKPDSLTYASWGSKSPGHFYGELVSQTTGVKMLHVPYDGGSKAMLSAIGGHTDLAVVTLASAKGSIVSGQVTALAISSDQRDPEFPNVPTIKELGFPKATYLAFDGFVVNAESPKDQIAKLRDAFDKTMSDPKIKEALHNTGMQLGVLQGPQYEEFMRSSLVMLKAVAVQGNLEE